MTYQHFPYDVSKTRFYLLGIMTPFQRLEIIAREEKRSERQIVEMSGRNPSIVSALRNGKKAFTEELAKAIEDKFGYRKEWILTGEGERKVEEPIIYNAPYHNDRAKLKGIRIADNVDLVPILKTPLYARTGYGYAAYPTRPPEEQEWEFIPPYKLYPGIKPEDHTIVTINGDSMEPRLKAGFEMLAYRLPDGELPRVGKIVMLDYRDELIIKSLVKVDWDNKEITVESDNTREQRIIKMEEIRRVFHVYDYHKGLL
ncbi:S24 family peptidase [Spirosoma sp. SC4-14]|uniref:S24 family peptidase n=1 Tax=Spirosoma sp. SC4-14 TaxID=3128900 RepID=UPI0030D5970A